MKKKKSEKLGIKAGKNLYKTLLAPSCNTCIVKHELFEWSQGQGVNLESRDLTGVVLRKRIYMCVGWMDI